MKGAGMGDEHPVRPEKPGVSSPLHAKRRVVQSSTKCNTFQQTSARRGAVGLERTLSEMAKPVLGMEAASVASAF
jgi:hypothetical protein